jgi:hypothetical protein
MMVACSPIRFEDTASRLLFFAMAGIIGLHFAFSIFSTYWRTALWGRREEKGNKNNTQVGVGAEGALAADGRQRLHSSGLIDRLARNSNPSEILTVEDAPLVLREEFCKLLASSAHCEKFAELSPHGAHWRGAQEDTIRSCAKILSCSRQGLIDGAQCTHVILVSDICSEMTGIHHVHHAPKSNYELVQLSIERLTLFSHDYLSWWLGLWRVKLFSLYHKNYKNTIHYG